MGGDDHTHMVMGDHPLQLPGAPDLRDEVHAVKNMRADKTSTVVHQLEEWDSDEDLEELEFDTLDTLEDMENPEADIVLAKDAVPMDGDDCWLKLKDMLTLKLEEEADEDDDPTNDDDEIKIGKLRHQVDRDPEGRGYTRFVQTSEDWLSLHRDWGDEQQIRRKKKLKDAAKSMVSYIGGEKTKAKNALRGLWEMSCRDLNHGNIEDFAIMAIARMLHDDEKTDDEGKMVCSGILWCMWENMVEKNSELKPQLLNIIKILINATTPKTKAQKQHEASVKAAEEVAKKGGPAPEDEDAPPPPPPVPEKKLTPAEEEQNAQWRYRTKIHCSGALASLATNDYAQMLMKDPEITSELVRIAPEAPHAMAALCYCLQRGDAHEVAADGRDEKTARAKFNNALKGLKGGIKMAMMGKHASGTSSMSSTMKKDQIKLKKARPNLAVRKLLQKRPDTAAELVEMLKADDYEIRLCALGVLTLITKDSVGVRSLSHPTIIHTLIEVMRDSIERWKAGAKAVRDRKRRKQPPIKRKNSIHQGDTHGQQGESAKVSLCSRERDDLELLLQMAQYAACALHGACFAIASAFFPEQLDVELHGKYKPPPDCRIWAKKAASTVTQEEIMFMISVARGSDKQMAMRALDALACLGHTTAANVMADQPELLDAVIRLTGSTQHRARASACSCIVGMAQNVTDQTLLFSREELLTNILLSFSPKFENDRLLCQHAAASLFFMCKNAKLQVVANIQRENMERALVPFKMSNLPLIKFAASAFFHIALIRSHRTTFAELGAPGLLIGWTATLMVSGTPKARAKVQNEKGKLVPGTPAFAAWQLATLPDHGVEGRLHLLEYLLACIWLMAYDEKAAISFGEETGGLLVLIDLLRDCDAQIGKTDQEERAAESTMINSRPAMMGNDFEFAAAAQAFLGTDEAAEKAGAAAAEQRAEFRECYVELKISALAAIMVACDKHPHNMTIVIGAGLPQLLLLNCLDPLHHNDRTRMLALQLLRKCLYDPTARADADCSRTIAAVFEKRGMQSLESACLLLAQGELLAGREYALCVLATLATNYDVKKSIPEIGGIQALTSLTREHWEWINELRRRYRLEEAELSDPSGDNPDSAVAMLDKAVLNQRKVAEMAHAEHINNKGAELKADNLHEVTEDEREEVKRMYRGCLRRCLQTFLNLSTLHDNQAHMHRDVVKMLVGIARCEIDLADARLRLAFEKDKARRQKEADAAASGKKGAIDYDNEGMLEKAKRLKEEANAKKAAAAAAAVAAEEGGGDGDADGDVQFWKAIGRKNMETPGYLQDYAPEDDLLERHIELAQQCLVNLSRHHANRNLMYRMELKNKTDDVWRTRFAEAGLDLQTATELLSGAEAGEDGGTVGTGSKTKRPDPRQEYAQWVVDIGAGTNNKPRFSHSAEGTRLVPRLRQVQQLQYIQSLQVEDSSNREREAKAAKKGKKGDKEDAAPPPPVDAGAANSLGTFVKYAGSTAANSGKGQTAPQDAYMSESLSLPDLKQPLKTDVSTMWSGKLGMLASMNSLQATRSRAVMKMEEEGSMSMASMRGGDEGANGMDDGSLLYGMEDSVTAFADYDGEDEGGEEDRPHTTGRREGGRGEGGRGSMSRSSSVGSSRYDNTMLEASTSSKFLAASDSSKVLFPGCSSMYGTGKPPNLWHPDRRSLLIAQYHASAKGTYEETSDGFFRPVKIYHWKKVQGGSNDVPQTAIYQRKKRSDFDDGQFSPVASLYGSTAMPGLKLMTNEEKEAVAAAEKAAAEKAAAEEKEKEKKGGDDNKEKKTRRATQRAPPVPYKKACKKCGGSGCAACQKKQKQKQKEEVHVYCANRLFECVDDFASEPNPAEPYVQPTITSPWGGLLRKEPSAPMPPAPKNADKPEPYMPPRPSALLPDKKTLLGPTWGILDDDNMYFIVVTLGNCMPPLINPNSGDVQVGSEVKISCDTDDCEIYFTINGPDPTPNAAEDCLAPAPMGKLRIDGSTVSAQYLRRGGELADLPEEGAMIQYINGPTKFDEKPIVLTGLGLYKITAIAVKKGMKPSVCVSETYNVKPVDEVKKPWTLWDSIWVPRTKESDSRDFFDSLKIHKKTFELDWKRCIDKPSFTKFLEAQLAPFVSEGEEAMAKEIAEVKQEVWEDYDVITHAFDFYAACSRGNGFSVKLNCYSDFLDDCMIPEEGVKECDRGMMDSIFIATNVEDREADKKLNEANADRELMRFEWVEMLVRCACHKFLMTGRIKDPSEAIDEICEKNVLAHLEPAAAQHRNDFRTDRLYNEEVDDVYKPRMAMLKKIFDIITTDKPQTSTKMMSMVEWLNFVDAVNLLSDDFTKREAQCVFVWSKMRVTDELKSNFRWTHATFMDFLEMLGRSTEYMTIPDEE
jgi:hypothetical protein